MHYNLSDIETQTVMARPLETVSSEAASSKTQTPLTPVVAALLAPLF